VLSFRHNLFNSFLNSHEIIRLCASDMFRVCILSSPVRKALGHKRVQTAIFILRKEGLKVTEAWRRREEE
jgi:hypothetical protein